MAEAPKTSEISKLNQQLTRALSNMLYEDKMDSLIKKYDEIDDKSTLLPEVQKAMLACLTIQDVVKDQFGEKAHLEKTDPHKQELLGFGKDASVQNMSSESLLYLQNPSSLFQDDEMEIDSANPVGNGQGRQSFDLGMIHESGLKEVNPSSCFSTADSSISSWEGGGVRKRGSSVSLEAVNLSFGLKSRESLDLSFSGQGGSTMQSGSVDSEGLVVANPSFEDIDESSTFGRENFSITDLISRSRFVVTIKPSTLKTDTFSKVNLYSSSSFASDYFNKESCLYTIPVDGYYKFSVRKLGHQNFQCCLRKDGPGSRDEGEASQAVAKWRRGTSMLVVRWLCSAGHMVWVEGKGQMEDCEMAVVFTGSLLKS